VIGAIIRPRLTPDRKKQQVRSPRGSIPTSFGSFVKAFLEKSRVFRLASNPISGGRQLSWFLAIDRVLSLMSEPMPEGRYVSAHLKAHEASQSQLSGVGTAYLITRLHI